MLLRASSSALGDSAVDAADPAVDIALVESTVGHGQVLEAYAVAAHTGVELAAATAALRAVLGDDGWVEAAMTVAVFNGLVCTADASGIPLDEGVVSATAADRAQLRLDAFNGSQNSDLSIAGGAAPHPSLFG